MYCILNIIFFCIQNSMYCHKNLQCKLFYNEYNTVKWICYICTCNVWFLLWIYLYLLFYNTHIHYSENNLFECLLSFLLSIKYFFLKLNLPYFLITLIFVHFSIQGNTLTCKQIGLISNRFFVNFHLNVLVL